MFFKKKIKIGRMYLLDRTNKYNFKEYHPVKVIATQRVDRDRYMVSAVAPVLYPTTEDGYAVKEFMVTADLLTPTTEDEKVVVRCPLNVPKFTAEDEKALESIYIDNLYGHPIDPDDALRLRTILAKIRYARTFNDYYPEEEK